jgi:hypothetical protein
VPAAMRSSKQRSHNGPPAPRCMSAGRPPHDAHPALPATDTATSSQSAVPVSRSSTSAAESRPRDFLRPPRQTRVRLEGREERQVPCAVSGVSPAPDQVKSWPNLRFGKLVHQVMQFLTHCAHAARIRALTGGGSAPCRRRDLHATWREGQAGGPRLIPAAGASISSAYARMAAMASRLSSSVRKQSTSQTPSRGAASR